MTIPAQNTMSVQQTSTAVMKMHCVLTPWVDTTVYASQDTLEMELFVKLFARMDVGMEGPALLLIRVLAHRVLLVQAVKQTLMNVQKDLFSVTAVLTALTYQAGTTVNAETATMTMGCSLWGESHVKTLMSVLQEDTAAVMILFALIWMVDMIAVVHMEKTVLVIVYMRTKSSITGRYGCWKMIGAQYVHARRGW